MGIWLEQRPNHATHSREPFVPAVIAAISLAQRQLGYEPVTSDCVYGKETTLRCRQAYAPYKILNVVFVLVAGVGVFFLCRWFSEARWLPHVAFLLVTQSLLGMGWADGSSDRFVTEAPAAALMVTVSCLAVLMQVRRRVLYSALLGLALAALVLTKIIFLYFWPFLVAGLIVADLAQRTCGRRTVLLASVFLVAHFLPVGSWMARNFIVHDNFSVIDSGASKTTGTLSLRMAYNTMRDDEFAAGFWYYLPYKFNISMPKRSWERFQKEDANGFRNMGFQIQSTLRASEKENLITRMLLAKPWRHLRNSALMGWRGLFVQNRLGYESSSPYIRLLEPRSLPDELRPTLPEMIARHYHKAGREVYVVWFRKLGTAGNYGEAALKTFLNLETVTELADATLYRVPRPDNFAVGVRVSEFLGSGSATPARWSRPSGMHYHFRNAALYSLVLTNRSYLPDMDVHVALPRLAEIWGLESWPRWRWRFTRFFATLVNLVGAFALVAMPLWFWFGHRRRIEAVFVVFPALYMHTVYAMVSHFIPRYAEPEVPLRILATLLLFWLAVSSLRGWSERRLKGRRKILGSCTARAFRLVSPKADVEPVGPHRARSVTSLSNSAA